MSAFCCKQSSILLARLAVNSRIAVTSNLGFQKFRFLVIPINFLSHERRLTSLADRSVEEKHSFAVTYLVDSCGLSQQNAVLASKKVHFETSDRADAVLSLLKKYGCESSHISRIIRKYPKVLVADPEENLRPKLEFFRSVGLSGRDLPEFLMSTTNLLAYGLENKIIPVYECFRNIVGYDAKPSALLKSCNWWVPGPVAQRQIVLNLQHMEELGAPRDMIMSSLNFYTTVYFQRSAVFAEKAKKLIDMGLEPTKINFVQGLAAITKMSVSTWQHKTEIYKRWGWSDEDIRMAFRKDPLCIRHSEEKIMTVMDFLVNKIGIGSSDVARNPIIVSFSLEKRTFPRSSVVRFLQMKGFVNKKLRMSSFLKLSEKLFLDKYVTKYQEQVPHLSDLYQGNLDIKELGVGFEDMNWKTYV
ncbi:hypothetical protein DCAR_0102940 [Daucus carota subsp. sativus]|uniref:Uncharacterized protein n=1 Tax=Daucus carota subsp. sativus TaxID=79200 RepID=A0A166HEC8_DAUCS|nr:PREDICTED: transcription termination factor MTERF15, mitochondrial-like [Daucus carota subsp. sativus]XP_017229092.1 PREDICTED: transcription termination factor MTERF15, mitochondrial-like [Daucus carota subsp. sativus]WOG83762.1 hypothetical protein DCAR_0102940 [Daucus carota subsp. sativus]